MPNYDVTVAWAPDARAVQYVVQRSLDGIVYGNVATVAGLSYTDIGVPSGDLWYRLIAQNSVGSATGPASHFTCPGTATAPTLTQPSVDTLLATYDTRQPVVILTWTPTIVNPSDQIVQRSDDLGQTFYNISGSLGPTVATFTDQQLFGGDAAAVQASWAAVPGAYEYDLQRSTDGGVTWTNVSGSPTTALTLADTGMPTNQYVSYRVVALNSVGSTAGPSRAIWVSALPNLYVCQSYSYRIATLNSACTVYGVPSSVTTNPPILQLAVSTSEVPLSVSLDWSNRAPTLQAEQFPTASAGSSTSFGGVGVTSALLTGVSGTFSVNQMLQISGSTDTQEPDLVLTTSFSGSTIGFTPTERQHTGTITIQTVFTPGYNLYRGTTAPDWFYMTLIAGGLSQPQYVDGSVEPGVGYFYVVEITNIDAGVVFGPYIGIYSPGPVAQAAPTIVQDPLLPYYDLFWLPSYQALTYAVERSVDGGASYQTLASGLYGCFYVDANPPQINNTRVRYRLVASDAYYSAVGDYAEYLVPCGATGAPMLANQSSGIEITWSSSQNNVLVFFHLQRSLDNLTGWTDIDLVESNGGPSYSYLDTDVTAYQRYYYRVVTEYSGAGEQIGFSASLVFKVPGSAAGFRFVVNGDDLSAIVDRGSTAKVSDQISAKGATATLVLNYEGENSPPMILPR